MNEIKELFERVETLETQIKDLSKRVEILEKQKIEDREEQIRKLEVELNYAKYGLWMT
jgi:regulator of replication initiation timing